MNMLSRFHHAALPALSATEKRVASYFSDHSGSITTMSILEVATECATSKSTVVRVCKLLGFKGYKDLLQYISAAIALKKGCEQPNDDTELSILCSHFTKQTIQILQNTLRMIDIEILQTIVDLLFSAPHLIFFGMEDYLMVAQDAALKFSRIGYPARASASHYCQVLDASSLEPSDLAFFFFDMQNIQDVEPLLSILHACKATSIAITTSEINQATYTLTVCNRQEPVGNLQIAMLGIIDMLFCSLTSTHAEYYASILQRTATVIQQERTCI